MKNHTKIYFDNFKIDYDEVTGWHEYISCEMCNKEAIDIHHIHGRMKGNKKYDEIHRIIALCRSCHEKAHANTYGYSRDCLQTAHENKMRINKIEF